jgi:hypothetical protein
VVRLAVEVAVAGGQVAAALLLEIGGIEATFGVVVLFEERVTA